MPFDFRNPEPNPGLDTVPADPTEAKRLLEGLQNDEIQGLMFHAKGGRWESANSVGYDVARKSVHALLLAQGLRVRPSAGHSPYEQAARQWLLSVGGSAGGRMAKAFSSAKKARHAKEYPSPHDRTHRDATLQQLCQDAVRIHNLACLELGVPEVEHLVPTDDNVAAWDPWPR